MLKITIPSIDDKWDPIKEEFVTIKGAELMLEHSLIAIQKWEAKYHKSYLNTDDKTTEEVIYYIKCMTVTPNVDPDIYNYIPVSELNKITDYINDPMTATTINERRREGESPNQDKKIITAEIIYASMIELGVPTEYRKWHISQLLTLIRVLQIRAKGEKKMSREEVLAQNRATNAKRRAASKARRR